ncbi:MAG: UDP-N-acetylglucosamine--N-acetylmuramyl-(pentapeptide) pyrophosphoryl-undecaprenol N-acetylglucosamine transferase [Wolbachia endosymbiont of Tyrophagus putrescentiae]|nr:UDP-N-acetylglucosamine--N-acetylmuramyl-(pentapeptide) pyrophosphoryl-undecaprenol N-acetylglucosamine transferase [Wolbachia endosymbiont of Tyrophagus putrescentiae]
MDIILATGGTGGHIFPALTLAKTLKAEGYKCILFTNKQINEIESYVLPLCRPSGSKLKFLFSLLYSCMLALYQMVKLRPRLVIGFGSYASFPTLFAAKILSIPIILHEQNIILGEVNRFFFKSALLVATSFKNTKYAEGKKCIFTGNFIETSEIHNYPSAKNNLNILIIAGSQGADFFDDVVSNIICDLPEEIKKKIIVTQQCKEKNISRVENLYKSYNINYTLSPFFNDLEKKLANSHVVISRAGATSIAEITLARRPAIYIPYPHAKDNHQFHNAMYIKNACAAEIIEQNSEAKKKLTELLIDLLSDCKKLRIMANNTSKTKIKNGVTLLIKIIGYILR